MGLACLASAEFGMDVLALPMNGIGACMHATLRMLGTLQVLLSALLQVCHRATIHGKSNMLPWVECGELMAVSKALCGGDHVPLAVPGLSILTWKTEGLRRGHAIL